MEKEEEKNTPEIDKASTESNGTFVFRGKHYRFADDAPKMILFAGEALSHQDIISDEEVLLQLIGGQSPLISKLAD